MRILGVDPGPAHTGWALLDGNVTQKIGDIKGSEFVRALPKFLQDEQPKVVVVENYIVRPKFRGGYAKAETIGLIGKIELICEMAGILCVKQEPAIKPVGYGYANLKYVPKKQGMHRQDAIAHAMFYWVTKCGGKPVG